ncbi:MAG: fatty acid desaturase [Cyanobacteria bacterium P01_E01_bin.6]
MVANIDKPIALNQFDFDLARNEYVFGLPQGINNWITNTLLKRKGEENISILYVMVNILLTVIPSAIALYCLEGNIPTPVLLLLGAAYVYLLLTTYARSFILGLHYSTHVPIFNKQWKFLKHISSNILCAFFGIPPLMYYSHHIAMHHSENNIKPYDLSSTMPYQRDSKRDHFKYMLRFVVAIWVELPYVLIQKNRYKVAIHCILGELFFFVTIFYLFSFRPIATTFVLILPTLVVSFALMQGNWKQHIFVDPDEPENNYRSTFTCINTTSNSLNFNDGYHIEHHENPAMPWYRLPEYFQSQIANYARHDAFIFTGIGSTQVGTMVLNGQFDDLADHYVNVGQKQRTKAELITEFKRRLQKM